jgi:hypothetical protein
VRDAKKSTTTHELRSSRRVPRAVTSVARAAEPEVGGPAPDLDPSTGTPWGWTLVGCDSDAGGALVVVRGPAPGIVVSVQVFDCPTMKVEVNGKQRTRLCVEAMVDLVRDAKIPPGTVAHVEEGGVEYGFSAQTAFVQGYNFGLWKGVLAASNLDVRVVKPQAWKCALGLAHKQSTKDESRALAGEVFPGVIDFLKRKKDHGRAEALLIAAYGHVAATARDERDANDEADMERVARRNDSEARPRRSSETNAEIESSTEFDSKSVSVSGDSASYGYRADSEDPLCALVREVVVRAVGERGVPDASVVVEGGDGSGLRGLYFGPYFGMSGKRLASEARTRNLKVSGRKMDLVERLETDDAERRRRRENAARELTDDRR